MKRLLRGTLVGALITATASAGGCKRAAPPIDSAALVNALTNAHQPATAAALVTEAAKSGDVCRYAEIAGRAALDADLFALAKPLLDGAPANCPRAQTLNGERAETLARAGDTGRAESEAQSVLVADPSNPYAQLALARVTYDRGQMTNCGDFADKALKAGRGGEAERYLGRSTLARSLFKEAEGHFQNLLKANPNDAEAAFSAGICNDKLGRYMQAREAFLQTLRIDPKHQMARVYLVVLTHNAGFDDEAHHDLAKLGELIPQDSPQYVALEKLLDGDSADAPDAGVPKYVPGKVQGKR